jgi:hypothetical protein
MYFFPQPGKTCPRVEKNKREDDPNLFFTFRAIRTCFNLPYRLKKLLGSHFYYFPFFMLDILGLDNMGKWRTCLLLYCRVINQRREEEKIKKNRGTTEKSFDRLRRFYCGRTSWVCLPVIDDTPNIFAPVLTSAVVFFSRR